MALLKHLLGKLAFGIAAILESGHFVCTDDKRLEKILYFGVRPDGPSGNHAIVSRTGHWMAVHRPKKDRLVLGLCLDDAFPEGGLPVIGFERQFGRLRLDIAHPLSHVRFRWDGRLNLGREAGDEQKISNYHSNTIRQFARPPLQFGLSTARRRGHSHAPIHHEFLPQ